MPLEIAEIDIPQIRNTFEFENPFLVKCIDEITFINKSNKIINSIYIDICDIKIKLKIKDSTGKNLIFSDWGDNPDCQRELSQSHAQGFNSNNPRSLIIEFKKEIRPREKNIIFLEYFKEFSQIDPSQNVLQFLLPASSSRFITLTFAKNYVTRVTSKISKNGSDELPSIISSDTEGVIIRNSIFFYQINIQNTELYKLLEVSFHNSMTSNDKTSICVGFFLGIIALIMEIYFWSGISNNITSLSITAVTNTAVISYLLVSRGWISTKYPDIMVDLSGPRLPRLFKNPVDYSALYYLLILLLFLVVIYLVISIISVPK
ncbi:hypothetical protein [Methanosphaerula subterraneus]|uniref:hypothetical protein n=1 Tax=Methanosphaerula subterraneus TaxID=3350244 RepID=UPI003F836744